MHGSSDMSNTQRGPIPKLDPPTQHRIRQLLNTYSGEWTRRGPLVFMLDRREDEDPVHTAYVEQPIGTFASDDAAELVLLLREWFWPLHNEIVMLRKRLADAQEERRLLYAELRKDGIIV